MGLVNIGCQYHNVNEISELAPNVSGNDFARKKPLLCKYLYGKNNSVNKGHSIVVTAKDHHQPNMLKTEVSEMVALNFFEGRWKTEGEIKGEDNSPPKKIMGHDIYEWVAGGFFLLHRVDVMMGNERTEVIEIIGSAGKKKDDGFALRSFDNQGNVVTMKGYLEKPGVFKIEGAGMRSTLLVSGDQNVLTVVWEQSTDDSQWVPWMELKLTRQA